eukprot:scaffold212051_cov23-Tisochrysis_lutea.AAC.1
MHTHMLLQAVTAAKREAAALELQEQLDKQLAALGKIEVDSAMSLPNSVLCLSFPAPPYWAHSAQQGRHGLLQGARKACFLCL